MAVTQQILRQAGVLAYRIVGGKVEVLLMTSRDTGRWIIPKGNIAPGTPPVRAAAREAYEEAGIKGTIGDAVPLGSYTYSKRLSSGEARPAAVEVYLVAVEKHLDRWPEKGERRRRWLSAEMAAQLVEEPGVVPLLRRLMELEDDLAKSVPPTSSKKRSKSSA